MEMYSSVLYKADQRSPGKHWNNQNEQSAPVDGKKMDI